MQEEDKGMHSCSLFLSVCKGSGSFLPDFSHLMAAGECASRRAAVLSAAAPVLSCCLLPQGPALLKPHKTGAINNPLSSKPPCLVSHASAELKGLSSSLMNPKHDNCVCCDKKLNCIKLILIQIKPFVSFHFLAPQIQLLLQLLHTK